MDTVPESETVIGYNHTEVAENEELQEVVRKTVEQYEEGGPDTQSIAASPNAVEQFENLDADYVEYRNAVVEVTAYVQS